MNEYKSTIGNAPIKNNAPATGDNMNISERVNAPPNPEDMVLENNVNTITAAKLIPKAPKKVFIKSLFDQFQGCMIALINGELLVYLDDKSEFNVWSSIPIVK